VYPGITGVKPFKIGSVCNLTHAQAKILMVKNLPELSAGLADEFATSIISPRAQRSNEFQMNILVTIFF
jgi:hypothetical protein